MRITLRNMALPALALAAVGLVAACDMGQELDVRTFTLEYLQDHEAANLVEPYVYRDREGAAGELSVLDGAITVRETPDNLDKIARVLAEYDKGRADVRLHFQLIEADGFSTSDPRIAAVEEELRKIFQFRGYRLAGEAFVSATDDSDIGQRLQGSDGLYDINGMVMWSGPGTIRLQGISLSSRDVDVGLYTTVNVQPGQTLVLGSTPKPGTQATLLLTVRAEEVPSSNQ